MQLQITISICQSEAGKKWGGGWDFKWSSFLGESARGKKRTCPDGQSLREYEMDLKEVKQKMIK